MKIVTLLENTVCRPDLAAARGLSLYVETRRHRILFDMAPTPSFWTTPGAWGWTWERWTSPFCPTVTRTTGAAWRPSAR